MKKVKHETIMKCVIIVMCIVLTNADDYQNQLTKLWSSSVSDGSSVVNVTSASIVIQPSYVPDARGIKLPYARYAFKPRAIPLRKDEQPQEKNAYYSHDVKFRTLFPSHYYVSNEKNNETERQARQFRPVVIPLIRNEEFQRRSLDVDEEPIIEKPEGFTEQAASRRSLSDMLDVTDDDDDDEDDEIDEIEGEYEREDVEDKGSKKKRKKIKIKPHKMKKYMLPLLLAYKMKFFSLIPVMMGGLVLLVGATGMAGFFFALFAAVMGLQKGGY